MHIRKHFLAHAVAYAALVTVAACGALEGSLPGQTVQDSNNVSPTTTGNGNDTVNGNANQAVDNPVVTSPNTTTGNSNSTDGNAMNSNTTNGNNTHLVCDKTWTNYAQAFFTNNCASCHNHNHSSLTGYAHVVSTAPTIQTYISARIMPVGATLSAGDYNNILNWFACNTPQ